MQAPRGGDSGPALGAHRGSIYGGGAGSLPHLRLALGSTNDDPGYETLLRIQQAKLERLKHELAEFIRKNDYQAIKEGFGSEGDAWLRAIAMVVGGRIER
jgi:hypothetical protein